MKTQYETILVNNHDRWVRLILNRPDVKNALSEKMTTELLSVLESVKEDKNIRGVSIEGSGDAYCAEQTLKTIEEILFSKLLTLHRPRL